MAETMVITMRFHGSCESDMALYDRLKLEAGDARSLAFVAKERIRGSYQLTDRQEESRKFLERVTSAVREEMKDSGMKIAGAILSGMQGTQKVVQFYPENRGNPLPEEGGELPEGTWDFLGQD